MFLCFCKISFEQLNSHSPHLRASLCTPVLFLFLCFFSSFLSFSSLSFFYTSHSMPFLNNFFYHVFQLLDCESFLTFHELFTEKHLTFLSFQYVFFCQWIYFPFQGMLIGILCSKPARVIMYKYLPHLSMSFVTDSFVSKFLKIKTCFISQELLYLQKYRNT